MSRATKKPLEEPSKQSLINRSLGHLYYHNKINYPCLMKAAIDIRNCADEFAKNEVMAFFTLSAINDIFSGVIFRQYEAWQVVNSELRKAGLPELSDDGSFSDLCYIRNKKFAHKSAAYLYENASFGKWYKTKYGSLEKTFLLIKKITKQINAKIVLLSKKNGFDVDQNSNLLQWPSKEEIKELASATAKLKPRKGETPFGDILRKYYSAKIGEFIPQ